MCYIDQSLFGYLHSNRMRNGVSIKFGGGHRAFSEHKFRQLFAVVVRCVHGSVGISGTAGTFSWSGRTGV